MDDLSNKLLQGKTLHPSFPLIKFKQDIVFPMLVYGKVYVELIYTKDNQVINYSLVDKESFR